MSYNFLKVDGQILADSGTSDESATNLYTLCDDIGPRFAGTDGYRKAADFMLAKFEEYQLENVRLEPFEITAWRRGKGATFAMNEPVARSYPCNALPYGAATKSTGIEAEVVDIGTGSDGEVEAKKDSITGRFVLTTSTAAHRTVVCAKCAALGAVGFILSNTTEGMILPTGSVADGGSAEIPAIGICLEDALQIRRFADSGPVSCSMSVVTSCEPATTWNVVGELTGTEFSDELVIMGGHLDSHDITVGALDNAAGAVQVMEVARLLAKQRKHLKRTVRFIGFGAEEIGLLGSHHHAKLHADELGKARFMLNSDCPSLGNPKGLAFHGRPQAEPYVQELSRQMKTPIPLKNRFHCHSDHYPFILQGVPTAGMGSGRFQSGQRAFVHMAADTPDKISLTDLREGAAFAARVLLRASSDENWPDLRWSAEEVEELPKE